VATGVARVPVDPDAIAARTREMIYGFSQHSPVAFGMDGGPRE
jgi:hypothetical protein